jgi:protein-disulfide isomerase
MSTDRSTAAAAADRGADVEHADGPEDAPHVLLMYGDYECPYTRAAHLAVRGLQRAAGGSERGTRPPAFRYVYRHFPLRGIHPHAQAAAEAAEAAQAQGRFWAMHDHLFSHQRALEDDDLRRYAGEVGLDAARVARDLEGCVHAARVQRDVALGVAHGVHGTPTLFVDGARYHGERTPAALGAALAGGATP